MCIHICCCVTFNLKNASQHEFVNLFFLHELAQLCDTDHEKLGGNLFLDTKDKQKKMDGGNFPVLSTTLSGFAVNHG